MGRACAHIYTQVYTHVQTHIYAQVLQRNHPIRLWGADDAGVVFFLAQRHFDYGSVHLVHSHARARARACLPPRLRTRRRACLHARPGACLDAGEFVNVTMTSASSHGNITLTSLDMSAASPLFKKKDRRRSRARRQGPPGITGLAHAPNDGYDSGYLLRLVATAVAIGDPCVERDLRSHSDCCKGFFFWRAVCSDWRQFVASNLASSATATAAMTQIHRDIDADTSGHTPGYILTHT